MGQNLRPQNCRWIGVFKHELSNIGVTVLADFVSQVLGGSYANAPVSGRSRTGGLKRDWSALSPGCCGIQETPWNWKVPSRSFKHICTHLYTHSQVRLI